MNNTNIKCAFCGGTGAVYQALGDNGNYLCNLCYGVINARLNDAKFRGGSITSAEKEKFSKQFEDDVKNPVNNYRDKSNIELVRKAIKELKVSDPLKCEFCGGEATATSQQGWKLCDTCYHIVPGGLMDIKKGMECCLTVPELKVIFELNINREINVKHRSNILNLDLIRAEIERMMPKPIRKCKFCGGDIEDGYNSIHNVCGLCDNCVPAHLAAPSPYDGPVTNKDLIKYYGYFIDWSQHRSWKTHPNYDLAKNKILDWPVVDDNRQEIEDLKKVRHQLESKVVEQSNKIAELTDKNDKLEKRLWTTVEDHTKQLKQERNDWEKLAAEYRFKAEKLTEQVKELNEEADELALKINTLSNENERLKSDMKFLENCSGLKLIRFNVPTY